VRAAQGQCSGRPVPLEQPATGALHPAGRSEPWATIQTKKPHALLLHLTGPKGKFGLGRLLELGADRELDDTRGDRDVVRLQFVQEEHLHRGGLEEFLKEHLESLNGKN
jgi:hypothetical protein